MDVGAPPSPLRSERAIDVGVAGSASTTWHSRKATPMQMVHNVALVLGGGGAAGNAWEIGIIAGLAEAGLEYGRGRRSGGRHVVRGHRAAQVRSGMPSAELFGLGAVPVGSTGRAGPGTAAVPADGHGVRANEGHRRRRHLGSRSATCDGGVRVGERLRTRTRGGTAAARDGRREVAPPEWPDRPMIVVAVDAHTGELAAFDRDSALTCGRGHREAPRCSGCPHAQHQRHSLHQRWRAFRRKR